MKVDKQKRAYNEGAITGHEKEKTQQKEEDKVFPTSETGKDVD